VRFSRISTGRVAGLSAGGSGFGHISFPRLQPQLYKSADDDRR
jgi:hypothetical protein